MSRSDAQFPGLGALAKANGVNYLTALMRAKRGWPIHHAGSVPAGQPCPDGFVKKRPGPKPMLLAEPPPATAPRLFAWERPEWNAKARAEAPTRFVAPPVKARKQYKPRVAEDTAPYHIQRVRTAYCNEFIRTGVLNEELAAKLRDYANAQRTSAKHLERVPAEHEVRRYGQETARVGDLGGGGTGRVDETTAREIARYLRPE